MINRRSRVIPISDVAFSGNEERYVVDAVRSGWVSSIGAYVDRFEKDFAAYLGAESAVSVSNGTVALQLALVALRIGPGDEVIVPDLTFAATVNAVLHAGATPVLVDSEVEHWNLDVAAVEAAITPATKAIIAVHLYGHPCDMKGLLALAERHGLRVIEDVAEALGAEVNGHKMGALGDVGCFSFYGNKVITAGEGGMCVTNDPYLAKRMRQLRDHGMSRTRRYWHEEVGFNFRLTNLNAAVGLAQLEQLDELLAYRSELAVAYEERLSQVPGLRTYPASPYGRKIDWLFCAFVDPTFPLDRDALLRVLGDEYNIQSRPTFYPMHLMPPYREIRRVGTLENGTRFGLGGINLPLNPTISFEDVQYIADALSEIGSGAGRGGVAAVSMADGLRG